MPPSKADIKETTLQLFIYDLQEGLGQKPEAVDVNRHYFWRRFSPDLFPEVYSELTPEHKKSWKNTSKKRILKRILSIFRVEKKKR